MELDVELFCGHHVTLVSEPESYFIECPWCPNSASCGRSWLSMGGRCESRASVPASPWVHRQEGRCTLGESEQDMTVISGDTLGLWAADVSRQDVPAGKHGASRRTTRADRTCHVTRVRVGA